MGSAHVADQVKRGTRIQQQYIQYRKPSPTCANCESTPFTLMIAAPRMENTSHHRATSRLPVGHGKRRMAIVCLRGKSNGNRLVEWQET